MNKSERIILFFLRLFFGFFFLYAGLSKILTPEWTALNYLKTAKTLSFFYDWLALPQNIGWVNFLNQWGLTLVGLSLALGIFIRVTSSFGILIMILYYLPILNFPYVGKNAFIIDEHIIYIFIFLTLMIFDAGKYWGIKNLIFKKKKS